MIQIYSTNIGPKWTSDKLDRMLLPLPGHVRTRVLAYKEWQDRQARILGKIMLVKLLEHFKIDLSMDDMKYTAFNKPYFSGEFNFSTAHSGDMVVCAGTVNGEIGLDIEQIVPIEFEDYQEQLTPDEWEYIKSTENSQTTFFQIWTRKEALLKALGRGADMDMNKLNAIPDQVSCNGKTYHLYPLSIAEGYIAYIATCGPFDRESIFTEKLSHPYEK